MPITCHKHVVYDVKCVDSVHDRKNVYGGENRTLRQRGVWKSHMIQSTIVQKCLQRIQIPNRWPLLISSLYGALAFIGAKQALIERHDIYIYICMYI